MHVGKRRTGRVHEPHNDAYDERKSLHAASLLGRVTPDYELPQASVCAERRAWGGDAPTRPTNPYGASKLAADHAIGFECAAGGLGAVSLRYFNVAGAYGPYGERHDPETHLVPLLLEAGLRDEEADPVRIYGRDYPTPDGTAVRDYIHVRDLADAHLLALEATAEPGHRVYNLGNGRGFSVREVVEAARTVTGRAIPAVDAPRRLGDPPVLVASSELIRRELGWAPGTPELDAIVADAWAWLAGRSGQRG